MSFSTGPCGASATHSPARGLQANMLASSGSRYLLMTLNKQWVYVRSNNPNFNYYSLWRSNELYWVSEQLHYSVLVGARSDAFAAVFEIVFGGN